MEEKCSEYLADTSIHFCLDKDAFNIESSSGVQNVSAFPVDPDGGSSLGLV